MKEIASIWMINHIFVMVFHRILDFKRGWIFILASFFSSTFSLDPYILALEPCALPSFFYFCRHPVSLCHASGQLFLFYRTVYNHGTFGSNIKIISING